MNTGPLPDQGEAARRWALRSWLLLIALVTAWWLTGLRWPPGPAQLLAGLLILPLGLAWPALLRGSRRGCAAATLLVLPYMGWGVTEMIANPSARLFAFATVLSSMASFVLLVLWLRVMRSA